MRKRVLTIAAFVGLQLLGLSGIDSAQAQFTYNLNNQTFTGFNFIQPSLTGFTGTLTSVSVNVTLNASVAYTYADDICIYVDIAPLSTGGFLQVGGWSNLGAAQRYSWPNGGSDAPGTTCIGTVTLTTPIVFTGTASDPVLWIGNGYGAAGTSGTWTGSLTMNGITPAPSGPTCTAPTLSATTVAAVCQGSTDGSVDLTITGGSPTPLGILWSNGATGEDLSNVAAGTYTVTVTTQSGGCSATGSYTVADGPTPTLWYADSDGDGYGNAASSQSSCTQPTGYVANNTDCNDSNSSANPGVATDGCDGVDNDCDGSTDEDATFSNYYVDADGDGYGAGAATSSCSAIAGSVTDNTDCNDGDNSVNPGVAADLCNGVDNDCDGSTDEDATLSNYYVDADGDGYGAGSATSSCAPVAGSVTTDGDCDDTNNGINPGATETCNSIDDNCNGSTDEGLTAPTTTASACGSYTWSVNGQTYTASGTYIAGNAPSSIYTSLATFSAAVGAAGQTQSATENFSGFNGFYGSPITGSLGSATTWSASAAGGIYCGAVGTDQVLSTNNPQPLTISFSPSVAAVGANIFLTDINFGVVPGSVYITLSNGTIDTVAVSTFNSYSGYVSNSAQISSITIAGSGTGDVYVTVDNLSVGTGTIAPVPACSTPVLVLTINTPSTYYADSDGDGYGNPASTQSDCSQPSGYVSDNTDCNDSDNSVNPGVAADLCNGVDNDCDGSTDEDATFSNYYVDADGDGYGAGAATSSCTAIAGSVTVDGDCNDSDNSVNPGVASDLCNGVDNDCDGSTDEDATFSNYYVDADGDGYGAGSATSSCAPVAGSVTVDGDCDDTNGSINPGATEICNSVDDNCDAMVDEGTAAVSGAGAISGTAAGCVTVAAGNTIFSIAPVANATNYLWTVPANMTIDAGQGTSSITVSWTAAAIRDGITGNITVTPSNSCNSGNQSSLAVDLNYTVPVRPSSISGPVKICPGDNGTYSVSGVARATSYDWSLPTGMIISSGDGSNVINVTVNASYNGGVLMCSAVNACGTGLDRNRTLGLNKPDAPASISGTTSGVCGASGVSYTASSVTGAFGYNWSVPAGATIVSGQGTTTVSVDFTGTYSGGNITVEAVNGCGSGSTRSVTVSGAASRPGPITGDNTICPGQTGVSYSTSTSTGAGTYLWTLPTGTTIVSGNGTKDILTNWGTSPSSGLTVAVRASNACGTSISRALNGISIASMNCGSPRMNEGTEGESLNLYPNPATDNFELSFSSTNEQPYRVILQDATGKEVHSESGMAVEGRNSAVVNISRLSSGIYLVSCEINGQRRTTRLAK